jgi:hypothetical protein
MNSEVVKQILSFVANEPKSIHEIAQHVQKSWKTIDKYVQEIQKDYPELRVKVFRKGSHGALKVVYLENVMQKSKDEIKEKFLKAFLTGNVKDDFDVLDFFMHVKSDKKNVVFEQYEKENVSVKQELAKQLFSCQHTLYNFSGNLSWINVKEKGVIMITVLEDLVKRGVKIKVLCRIDPASLRNITKLKSLDKKHGTDLIEIRHLRHPLRGFIFDDRLLRLKEEVRTARYKEGEIAKNLRIFYDVWDPEWANWMTNVFTYSFNGAMNLASYEDVVKKIVNYV